MGVPQRLYTDLGKEFCAAFQDGAELDDTIVEPSALEMPTQRSITERSGKTFKEVLTKAMETYAVQNDSEWRDLVDIVNMTVNRLTNKSGFSPAQRLLGYTPKMPGSLQFLSQEEQKERNWATRGDLQMQRAQTMRHIVKAAPEQLRHASEEEQTSLSSWMEGLSNLRHIMSEEPKAGYIDLTKEYNADEMDQEMEEIGLPPEEQFMKKPRYKVDGKTPLKEVEERPEEDGWMWNEQKGILTRFHLQLRQQSFRPTDTSDCPIDYNKLQGHRRTTMYFEDGNIVETVDDWRTDNPTQTRRWKGRTEFQLDPTPLPWDHETPKIEGTSTAEEPQDQKEQQDMGEEQSIHVHKREKFLKAIKKEIDNNINTGAYEILTPEESEEVRNEVISGLDIMFNLDIYCFIQELTPMDHNYMTL
ncbi:unnamed protein product, partial [Durusdinium trenchii]